MKCDVRLFAMCRSAEREWSSCRLNNPYKGRAVAGEHLQLPFKNGPPVTGAALCAEKIKTAVKLAPPYRNRSHDRARADAQRLTVIAGFDDPFSVLLANDLADVVLPHDHSDYSCRSRSAPMRPVARQIE